MILKVTLLKLLAIFGVLLLLVAGALAHDPGISGIRIIKRSRDIVISVSTHRSQLAKAEHQSTMSDDAVRVSLLKRLKVTINGGELHSGLPTMVTDPANDLITMQLVQPGAMSSFSVASRVIPELDDSKTIVSIAENGQVTQEVLLDKEHPSSDSAPIVSQQPSKVGIVGRFIQLGWFHILSGADHVLFVLGLLLLGGTWKSLLKTITAFTVAHSITLTLSVTGVFQPASKWIEPLIALSIVAIAVENLRPKSVDADMSKPDYRPWVAFSFGLIHGFGFAGALTDVGLSSWDLGLALACFNFGVEMGQACIVIVAAPAIGWAVKNHSGKWGQIATAGSVLIALVGALWFLERIR